MRVRVQSSWRTRLLLLLAFAAAGLIAWQRVRTRLAEERPPPPREPADPALVEVELVEP